MEHLSLSEWLGVVSALLLAISEILPFSKSIKSNGIFQAIISGLSFLKKK